MLIRQPYGYSIDWWALGTILFEISYKYLPFGGEDKEIITNNIKNMELVFPNDVKSVKYPRTEEEIQTRNSFIGGLLDRNVDARLGSSNDGLGFEKDIKTHPYLESINWDQLLNRKVKPTFKPSVLLI